MPISIKNAGVWKPAATGKLAFLQGNEAKFLNAMAVATPAKTNYWPLRDVQGQTMADDTVGTKDATYVGTDVATVHPNPFVVAKSHQVVFPATGSPAWQDPIARTTGSISIECRFRTKTNGPIWGTQAGAVGGAAPGGWVMNFYVGVSGRLLAGLYPGSGIASPGVVNDGAWHHAAITWNGTTQRVYLDGAEFGTSTQVPDRTAVWHSHSQLGAAWSGQWADSPGAVWWYFAGDITDFTFYTSVLSNSTIQAHADARPRWNFPAKIAVKRGAIGGGFWQDSAYLGYPGVPGTPSVAGWNFGAVRTQWTAPPAGSGAPVTAYQTRMLNEAGAVLYTSPDFSGPVNGTPMSTTGLDWYFGGLSELTKYQFQTRAKGAGGLYSAWSASLKVQIGRAQINTPASSLEQRGWYTNYYNGAQGVGGYIVAPNGANVTTHTIRLECYVGPSATGAWTCSPAGRRAHWWINGGDAGDIGCHNTHDGHYWEWQQAWGVNAVAWQGIQLTGAGWGGSFAGSGTVHLWGTEVYWYYYTIVTPAIENSYW